MYNKEIAELSKALKFNIDALQTSIDTKNELQQLIYKQWQQVQRSRIELKLIQKEQVWYDYLNPKCPLLEWLGW